MEENPDDKLPNGQLQALLPKAKSQGSWEAKMLEQQQTNNHNLPGHLRVQQVGQTIFSADSSLGI